MDAKVVALGVEDSVVVEGGKEKEKVNLIDLLEYLHAARPTLDFLTPQEICTFLGLTCKRLRGADILWQHALMLFGISNHMKDSNKTARETLLYCVKELNYFCRECGTPLDSPFGFFLFKNECFDCKMNSLYHLNPYDPLLQIPSDISQPFRDDFGIENWHGKMLSGDTNMGMNAFGCNLGGGFFWLLSRDGNVIREGVLLDLAHEICVEKKFFKEYFPNGIYSEKEGMLLNLLGQLVDIDSNPFALTECDEIEIGNRDELPEWMAKLPTTLYKMARRLFPLVKDLQALRENQQLELNEEEEKNETIVNYNSESANDLFPAADESESNEGTPSVAGHHIEV